MLRRLFPNLANATPLDWACIVIALILFIAPVSQIVRGLIGLPTIGD
jgi:hypothetical protein